MGFLRRLHCPSFVPPAGPWATGTSSLFFPILFSVLAGQRLVPPLWRAGWGAIEICERGLIFGGQRFVPWSASIVGTGVTRAGHGPGATILLYGRVTKDVALVDAEDCDAVKAYLLKACPEADEK